MISLITILLVSGSMVGATRAQFSDSATVTLNTFSTGVINLTTSPTSAAVTASNMAPGVWSPNYKLTLTNNNGAYPASTLPINLLTLTPQYTSGNGSLYNRIWVKVVQDNDPSNVFYQGLLKDMANVDVTAPKPLNPGSSVDVRFNLLLDSTADNYYQGISTTFNLIANAQQ